MDLAPQALYLGLGLDAESRFAAYRDLLRHALEPGLVDEFRQATNGNFSLGRRTLCGRGGVDAGPAGDAWQAGSAVQGAAGG